MHRRPQVRDGGICSCAAAKPTADGEGALAAIETLEGLRLLLRLDLGGVRGEPEHASDNVPDTVYDSVSSFLLNNSAGYKAHFNSSLFAALSKVAQERDAEEANAPS